MALSAKKKTDDDFILTISDNEDGSIPNFDEEILASSPPSNKKRKRNDETFNPASKKNKKAKRGKKELEEEEDDNEGIWGAKDEDDGAMDSDFEFALEADKDNGLEEFEGWGFESAKKGLNGNGGDKKGVDIDEIIARRRE